MATTVPRSISASGVIRRYHVYHLKNMDASCRRKSREPRNEYDRFAVAVLDDETMRGESLVFLGRSGPLFVRFVGGSALGFHDIGSGASFGSLLK